MNKKAITPLISSVTLLMFAVGLGVMVMSWGGDVSEESCESVGISVISVQNDVQACQTQNQLILTLENDGKSRVTGVKVSIIGENDIYQEDLPVELDVGEIRKIVVGKNFFARQVRVAPFGGNFCAESMVTVENVKSC